MTEYYSPLKSGRTEEYGDNPRTELIDLINVTPEKVFEIGCGSGATGMAIKNKFPDLKYVGMDSNKGAAEIAQTRLDKVIVSDLDTVPLDTFGFEKEYFDLIICADILEHLYDPWKILNDLHGYLAPGGRVLASIPNVQYINQIINLLNGIWNYEDDGLMDATHIRFFTQSGIIKMFGGTGYKIVNCSGTGNPIMKSDTWPNDFDFGKFVIKNVTREEAHKFSVLQYLIVAQKVDREL